MRRHQGGHPRQTKIMATLGLCPDGQNWPSFLESMIHAGVDIFRVNFSHANEEYEKEREIIDYLTRNAPDKEAPGAAVLGDLQGPKARIGKMPENGLDLVEGNEVQLYPSESGSGDIPIPGLVYDAVLRSLQSVWPWTGADPLNIILGDGEMVLSVMAIGPDSIRASVVAGDCLTSRKGITIRGVDIDLDPFSSKDERDLEFCLDAGIDMVAISFVRTAADIERVRDLICQRTGDRHAIPLIAKIETLTATQNIESIVAAADGIMIARGDLGLQLGVEQVPAIQKRLSQVAKSRGKPVIVATQMLESMIEHPSPTRAEATDVFNAILDGGDVVMLSGETSIGKRPCEVVQTMDRIGRQAEEYRMVPEYLKRYRKTQRRAARQNVDDPFVGRINQEIALTAVQFAEHIPARAIVSFTRTGGTPRRLSQYRPAVPLLAICSDQQVARRLLLYYGVHPIVMEMYEGDEPDFQALVVAARSTLRRDYRLKPGDAIVVTAGVNWPVGGTNVMRVMVEDLDVEEP